RRAGGAEDRGLVGDAAIEIAVERRRAARGVVFVEMQAVDLRDTGVGVDGLHVEADIRGTFEQRARDRRADDDACVRREAADRVHQFNLSGGVSEAVAGNVDDEGHRSWVIARLIASGCSVSGKTTVWRSG